MRAVAIIGWRGREAKRGEAFISSRRITAQPNVFQTLSSQLPFALHGVTKTTRAQVYCTHPLRMAYENTPPRHYHHLALHRSALDVPHFTCTARDIFRYNLHLIILPEPLYMLALIKFHWTPLSSPRWLWDMNFLHHAPTKAGVQTSRQVSGDSCPGYMQRTLHFVPPGSSHSDITRYHKTGHYRPPF